MAAERAAFLQVAINWCIGKGCIPIPGARTMAMVEDNLCALKWSLTGNEMEALDQASSRVEKGMIQNIFQTA
jgi:pyridoxine 4-dehydrogenase